MPEPSPLLSVIMPVFNEEEYLAFALESVLVQEVDFPYEIIVVDDYSTDGTAAVVERYRQAFPDIVRYAINPKNKGNAYSFWHGLTLSRGEFFHVLDGDDFFIRRDKLQRQVDFLQTNPDFAAVATNSLRMLPDTRFYSEVPPDGGDKEYTYKDVLGFGFYFHTSSYMYRNIYRDAVPDFLKEEWARGDGVRTVLHAKHGKVKYLDFIGSVYRFYAKGIWSAMSQQQQQERVIWALEQFREKLATSDEERRILTKVINYRKTVKGKSRTVQIVALILRSPWETFSKLCRSETRRKAVAFIYMHLLGSKKHSYKPKPNEHLTKLQRKLQTISYSHVTKTKAFAECYMTQTTDQFCEAIGKMHLDAKRHHWLDKAYDDGLVVILISGMQLKSGGVLREIIDLIYIHHENGQRIAVLSDELVATPQSVIEGVPALNLREVKFERCPEEHTSPLAKAEWLMDRLCALRPGRLYPFGTHHDVSIPTAVQAGLAREVVLDFCFDHGLSTGTTHSAIDSIFVKLPYHYHMLAKAILPRKLEYIPFFMEDAPEGKYRSYVPLASGKLTTMTACARSYKVGEYKYDYPHMIARMLAKTGGRHIHLGPLEKKQMEAIQQCLAQQGVPRERFVHIAWSDDLTQTARQEQVDVYLQSFPVGSGRTSVEMMRAGIPIINHLHHSSLMFNAGDYCAPDCPIWETPEELENILASMDEARLIDLSSHVRAFYESHNDFSKTRKMVLARKGLHAPYHLRYDGIVSHSMAREFVEKGPGMRMLVRQLTKRLLIKLRLFGLVKKVMTL